MFTNWSDELNRIARKEQTLWNGKGELSGNAWRFNDGGSAEPAECSFDTIFSAYNDYKMSLNWG